jgi:hypothetical protein
MGLRVPRRHDPASYARYQDLKQLARTQARVLAGTPGTLKQREQAGNRYWVREHVRVDGRKSDDYLGAVASVAEAQVAALRAEIELARALAAGSSTLRVFGYQRIERKAAAVLGVFYNRGLFGAGLVLVGAHAYGALLNDLGLIAPGYRTQDIDVARARPLAVASPEGMTFRRLLDETGLGFVPVPGMPSHRPSTSFKLPGAESLSVDLLVPGRVAGNVVPVKELATHAQAVAFLDFLIEQPIESVALSPNSVVPVRIPSPERFVLHKLCSSQSRRADRDKVRKDLEQAATIAVVVEEETPGRLRDLLRKMPAGAKTPVARGARAAARLLEGVHPGAQEALARMARS